MKQITTEVCQKPITKKSTQLGMKKRHLTFEEKYQIKIAFKNQPTIGKHTRVLVQQLSKKLNISTSKIVKHVYDMKNGVKNRKRKVDENGLIIDLEINQLVDEVNLTQKV